MPNIVFNYGSWEFWEEYNPPDFTFGNQKVTFDGDKRIIYVNEGEIDINVEDDIYSNWKEWVKVRTLQDAPNAKWPIAISAIGGIPITETQSQGTTFFLENGWRIKPWEGDYVLTINGNLYTREVGENPMIPTSGVSVSLTRSNLIDIVDIGSVQISANDIALIAATTAQDVWEELADTTTYGALVQQIGVDAAKALKKGEWIALSKSL